MNRQLLICISCSVVAFLIGIKTGWEIHRPPKCPECPEIVPQTLVVRDSSMQQPTVTHTVPTAQIIPTRQYQPVYHSVPAADSSAAMLQKVGEPVNCWSFDVVEPDSAQIAVELCSRTFSVQPPADLLPKIDYTPSPRVRIVERTNNVILPCPDPPKPKKWGVTIGPYLGLGINILGQPQATAGIGMSWGYRIRAR